MIKGVVRTERVIRLDEGGFCREVVRATHDLIESTSCRTSSRYR